MNERPLRRLPGLAGLLLAASLATCAEPVTTSRVGGLAMSVASTGAVTPVDSWRVTVSGPSSPAPQTGAPGATLTFSGLLPGSYSVLLEGLEGGVLASRGQSSAVVTAGQTNPVVVSVSPVVPEVTVSVSDASASELGPDAGAFTLTRATGSASGALTVAFTLGGTATAGVDYGAVAGSVTFGANQRTAVVSIQPALDTLPEGAGETVVLTVAGGAGYVAGAPASATLTIADAPVMTVVATDNAASEVGPDPGTFTITRRGPLSSAVSVGYVLSGSATAGTDYTATPVGSVTLGAGQATATVTIAPVADSSFTEGTERVILSLSSNPGAYAVAVPASDSLSIADTPPPIPSVTVAATDAAAAEAGPDGGTFRITRSRVTASALAVTVTIGGTASNGSDYVALASPVTIPANQAFVDVAVVPVLDTLLEASGESVVLTVASGTGYTLGATPSATVTIADAPVVAVVATDNAASEVGLDRGQFTITRRGPSAAALSVAFALSGTATPGTDYTASPVGSVTIAAGQPSAVVTITPLADANANEGPERVVLTLAANVAAYAVGRPASDSVTITDNCVPSALTVTPSPVPPLGPGGTVQLQTQSSACTGAPVTWSSANPTIASVSSTGLVTGLARGNATIRATATTNPAVFRDVAVSVVDILTVSVTPMADSVRVGTGVGPAFQRQYSATLFGDALASQAVTWASDDPAVATVSATGAVTGVGVGTTTIRATSVWNPARQGTATVKVGTDCQVPQPMALGQTVSGAVTAQSCLGDEERFAVRLASTQGMAFSGTSPWAADWAPWRNAGGWILGAGTTTTFYAIGPAGTVLTAVSPSVAGNTGTVSLGISTWSLSGCPSFFFVTGTISANLRLDAACANRPWTGAPSGTYFGFDAYLNPAVPSGGSITVTVTGAIGVSPRVEIFEGTSSTPAASGGTGGTTASATYTNTAVGLTRVVRMRVTTFTAGQAGNIVFSLSAPSGVLPTFGRVAGGAASDDGPRIAIPAGPPCATRLCEARIRAGAAGGVRR